MCLDVFLLDTSNAMTKYYIFPLLGVMMDLLDFENNPLNEIKGFLLSTYGVIKKKIKDICIEYWEG